MGTNNSYEYLLTKNRRYYLIPMLNRQGWEKNRYIYFKNLQAGIKTHHTLIGIAVKY